MARDNLMWIAMSIGRLEKRLDSKPEDWSDYEKSD